MNFISINLWKPLKGFWDYEKVFYMVSWVYNVVGKILKNKRMDVYHEIYIIPPPPTHLMV